MQKHKARLTEGSQGELLLGNIKTRQNKTEGTISNKQTEQRRLDHIQVNHIREIVLMHKRKTLGLQNKTRNKAHSPIQTNYTQLTIHLYKTLLYIKRVTYIFIYIYIYFSKSLYIIYFFLLFLLSMLQLRHCKFHHCWII